MAGARSGIILAGGRSSRIGLPKALLELGGEPLLRHVARALAPSCEEIVIVAAPHHAVTPELHDGLRREARRLARDWTALGGRSRTRTSMPRPRVRLVHDVEAHLGPVSGLAAGLAAARGEWAFVAACDVPFLVPQLIANVFRVAEASRQHDAIVVRWKGYLEPLVAAYRIATMAPHYARQLQERELRPTGRLDTVRVRVFEEVEVRAVDPEGRSFVNVNAPEDYAAARALGRPSAPAPERRPGRSPKGSSADG